MIFSLRYNYYSKLAPKKYTLEYNTKPNKYFHNDLCDRIVENPIINWNGNMIGCCMNPIDESLNYGNVFESGFFNVYFGNKLQSSINFHKKKGVLPPNIPCSKCSILEK